MTGTKSLAAVAFALTASLLASSGCSKVPEAWPSKPGKRVLVSFAPLYCFAQNVAGDDANVLCMTADTGPHGKAVSHTDMLRIRQADLVLCNGLELDDAAMEKLLKAANRKVKLVQVADDDSIPHEHLIHNEEEHDHGEKGHKHDEKHAHKHDHHHHHHGEHDPHVWLSPELAALMVDRIAKELSIIDPDHKEGFNSRAEAYKKELKKLHEYGLKSFADKKNKKFVAQHDSLRYFAQAFKLPAPEAIRLASGLETDPGAKAALVKRCKDVAALTYEPQYPKSEIDALQRTLKGMGVDTKVAELDPIETAPGNPNPDPKYYIDKMYANIDNLAKALP